jgi:hypothetical protein
MPIRASAVGKRIFYFPEILPFIPGQVPPLRRRRTSLPESALSRSLRPLPAPRWGHPDDDAAIRKPHGLCQAVRKGFPPAITPIIGLRAERKMGWITAPCEITGVADEKDPAWKDEETALRDNIRKDMGCPRSTSGTVQKRGWLAPRLPTRFWRAVVLRAAPRPAATLTGRPMRTAPYSGPKSLLDFA